MISLCLIAALIQVESNCTDGAVGDYVNGRPTSFGCLQISQKVIDDVNTVVGYRRFTLANAFHRPDSIEICLIYLDYWEKRIGRPATDQDRARIWNGGPDGWKKPETEPYWRDVRAALLGTNEHTWHFPSLMVPKIRSSEFEISVPPLSGHSSHP